MFFIAVYVLYVIEKHKRVRLVVSCTLKEEAHDETQSEQSTNFHLMGLNYRIRADPKIPHLIKKKTLINQLVGEHSQYRTPAKCLCNVI